MSASAMGAGQRQDFAGRSLPTPSRDSCPIVEHGPVSPVKGRAEFSTVSLGQNTRISLMVAPKGRGAFIDQAREVFSSAGSIMAAQPNPMRVTSQTVFLGDPADQPVCEELLNAIHGNEMPATNFVMQTPCCGAAIAVEAWAVRGDTVQLSRHGPHIVMLDYDGVQWLHCAGIQPQAPGQPVYAQTTDALERMRTALAEVGFDFTQVMRTWFYLGNITGPEGDSERYKELNRARTDFYQGISFFRSILKPGAPKGAYPASTGIGMNGTGLVVGCTAFRTTQDDTFVLPLENPHQVPAYAYHPKYSPQSPKFSRALALLRPEHVVTWISGTASIVNSESLHLGDIEKQTEQTLDNIERLIAHDNFSSHGAVGAGATFKDLSKVRIYIKRHEDYAKCRAVCEKRFGPVPAIYAVADVCRPELLVEIEGIAFSRRGVTAPTFRNNGLSSLPMEGK